MILLLLACAGDPSPTGTPPVDDEPTELLPEGYTSFSAARFSTDGTSVAGMASTADADHLVSVDLADGAVTVLHEEGLSYLTTTAWQGGTLYWSGDGGIWRNPASPELVVDDFAVLAFDVSPDGAHIAWSTNGGTSLYLGSLTTVPVTGEETLASGSRPRFDPTSSALAYVDDDAGNHAWMSLDERVAGPLPLDVDYLGNADWVDDDTLLLLGVDDIHSYTLGDAAPELVREAFAAMDLDVSPDGSQYLWNVNGQRQLFIAALP
ncbi:MAG: hypothetical protein H6736_03920 [Alphaproteobacteria bacterium]|nr:hypothetical protein [Alphaproteobacteria bacterium]